MFVQDDAKKPLLHQKFLLMWWQDLLTVELRWGIREGPYLDRLKVHRKGKPSQQEEEPLAHELQCWPNVRLFGCMQRLLVLL